VGCSADVRSVGAHIKKIPNAFVKRGWNLNICSNFGKRCQNEAAISQTRMGKGQLVGVNDERARENDVKVKGARLPTAFCAAVSTVV